MRRKLNRVVKTSIVPALVATVLFGLLQTVPGKAFLASALSRTLSRSEDVEVHIGRISGWIPGNIRIDHLEIGDAQGEWLVARNLHCRWILKELFKGRVRLKRLGAGEIELHRFPASSQTATVRERGPGRAPLISLQLDGLKVDHLRLGSRIAGIPLEYAVQSGGISLEQGRLSGGVAITGDAEGWVDFETSMTDLGGNQLRLNAQLDHMYNPTFGLDQLSGSGEATIDADGVTAVIVARLEEKGQTGNLASRLHYSDRQLQLQQFQFSGPRISMGGDVSLGFSEQLIDVAFNAGFVDSFTNHYALLGTASVAVSNKAWAVDVHHMEIRGWDTVACSVSGLLQPDSVDLQGELKSFDIGQLPVAGLDAFQGEMSGQFSVAGPMNEPQLDVGLEVAQFRSGKDALDDLPKLDFRIDGGISEGSLFASTRLTNFNGGYLISNVKMPADVSLSPFRFRLTPEETSGDLDADLNLAVFNGLAFMQNQHLEGALTASLSRKNQALAGFIKIERGSYEHYAWGIMLRDISAGLDALSNGFKIGTATASGAQSGRIELSGEMRADRLDLQLDLAGAQVVQRPEIEAKVSGKIKFTGPISRPLLSGRLVVDRADILPDNLVSQKPRLLTDYDARSSGERTAANQRRKPLPLDVDVQVEMPDQVYVNASMIDSVWGGALQINDISAGLSIKGEVTPRRGFVTFIGKKFRLQEGNIFFDGSVPAMPVFNNLTAEYSRSDITAKLILNGAVNDPQFRLESTPALPEDEILSHVLFNRDASTISPYQAIQIAAAARQLSGGLSGPGFMYGFRQVVGIDTLEWREPDAADGASSVAAGKYITPELYVEVDSTLDGANTTEMTAEYELNRHFSIETSAGPRMRPGIGVNWKNDY